MQSVLTITMLLAVLASVRFAAHYLPMQLVLSFPSGASARNRRACFPAGFLQYHHDACFDSSACYDPWRLVVSFGIVLK